MIQRPIKAFLILLTFYLTSCQSSKFTTIEFSDGTYKGEIDKKGKKHGKGIYIWLDGSTYEGDFRNDLRHGNGKFNWSNGESYKGDYLDDERTGFGIYYWPDGSYYEGSFLMGKRHGKGKYYSVDGTIYEGNWFDDLQHGEGILSQPNRNPLKSVWKNGQIVAQPAILPTPAIKPSIPKIETSSPSRTVSVPSNQNNFVQGSPPNYPNSSKNNVPVAPIPRTENTATYQSPIQQAPVPVTQGTITPPISPETLPPSDSSNSQNATIPESNNKTSSPNQWGSKIWTGTVAQAEEQFTTELINGIDTVKNSKSKIPFSGKMQILDPKGNLIGEVNLLDGQLHGEEVFINEAGVITEKNKWEKGVRVN